MQLSIAPRRAGGFTLIEVMITLVIVSIGLLGMAKLQAAALSETKVSRTRSLIALQTESLAAAMRGNRAFWADTTTPPSFTASGTTVSDTSGVLNAPLTDCATTTCSAAALAAYDVQKWAAALNVPFPSYGATVACAAATGLPASCDITVSWSERYVAINRSTATGQTNQTATQYLTLHVQP